MKWYEICIRIYESILEEPVNAFFFQLGASGTATEQKEGCLLVKGYIPEKFFQKDIHKEIERFLKNLHSIFPDIKRSDFHISEVEEFDWFDKWKDFFRPIQVSKDLVILPAWDATDIHAKYIIKIDPGPAFGTGQHPTTQLCLRALESLFYEITDEWNMLDIGTGTGILAIYGAMLGIRNIVAIDIDPAALRWAYHNIRLNNLLHKIILSSAPVHKIEKRFDVVTANLLFDEIKDIMPYIRPLFKRFLIISGILEEQIAPLEDLLKKHHIDISNISFQEDWVCIISQRR
ncbi:MAG: 50S ribosomal protein L11 methyltransferase [Deltaproteobacteria bacterium]|nr:MAG: 50S ribosomal protein L11 methyltransferase [Deltaproteobacteria bacterium]